MSDELKRTIKVNQVRLDHYLHEKLYARVDQVPDPNNLLLNVDKANCRALAV